MILPSSYLYVNMILEPDIWYYGGFRTNKCAVFASSGGEPWFEYVTVENESQYLGITQGYDYIAGKSIRCVKD